MSSLQLPVMGLDSITSKKSGSGSNTSVFGAFYCEVCFRERQVDAESQFALYLRAIQLTLSSINIQPSPFIPVQSQPHHALPPLISSAEPCSSLKSQIPIRKPANRADTHPAASTPCLSPARQPPQHPISLPAPPLTPPSRTEFIPGGHEDGQDRQPEGWVL